MYCREIEFCEDFYKSNFSSICGLLYSWRRLLECGQVHAVICHLSNIKSDDNLFCDIGIDCIHGLQEELKILRLRYSLLVEEEMETREKELNHLMEHKKAMKVFRETVSHQ